MSYKVLIIEDEKQLQNVVTAYFKKEGFNVDNAYDGLEGINLFKINQYNCICVDVMMPKLDGWEVVKQIREESDVPIVMLTALSSDQDALKGYSLKVDDYIPKPFSPPLLIAKVKNIVERYEGNLNNNKNVITINQLKIDVESREVFVKDKLIDLSKTEFDLLVYLITNKNIALTREQILDSVWGYDKDALERVVDTFIKTLRKKLGSPYATYIKTVFGVGYKFIVE
ncbi:response regulator transcription factor [Haloplasma contractile]|uniref:response regulator transcription factor n=1 Tax=Haloplasma contractile TaxID=471825 RepID=UPI000212151E|nr:response regulator transcription factor [Haloplasma contractile]